LEQQSSQLTLRLALKLWKQTSKAMMQLVITSLLQQQQLQHAHGGQSVPLRPVVQARAPASVA